MKRHLGILTLLLLLLATSSQAGFRRMMAKPVREWERAILHRNTRPEAMRVENDEGPVADSFPLRHMQLLLKRAPETEAALVQRIAELHDRSSPNFHKWLTPKQLRDEFGPAEADLNAVKAWLTSHGFTVSGVQASGLVVDFSGSARSVLETFHTQIHKLSVSGVSHFANTSDPSIPAALADVIEGVVSLHDFRPRTQATPRPNYTYAGASKTNYAVVPADLATIYNINPLFSSGILGQGQTIVLIENSNVYNLNDWTAFRSGLGLSSYPGTLTQIHPAPLTGANNCVDPGVADKGYELESTLDAQWASAAAPGASIVLASCADVSTTFGGLIALQNVVNGNNPPQIISISFGECETVNGATANAAFRAAYQQAVALGISVFVSSGDSGGASCDFGSSAATHGVTVNGIASTPYNVAVGGTDFADTLSQTNATYWSANNGLSYSSALSYIPEIAWNSTCASRLLATYKGFATTFGAGSMCNNVFGQSSSLASGASGGGPSACATGTPALGNVVGGTCAGYPKPSWQALTTPNDGVRDLPDVSLFAGNGAFSHYYVTCDSNPAIGGMSCSGAPSTWSGAGGTSYTAPIWAGFQALINQYTGSSQGNPNPSYYSLAAAQNASDPSNACDSKNGNAVPAACVFYDVTLGDSVVPCTGSNNCYLPSGNVGILSADGSGTSQMFNATSGWDFATGIGTVNVANLVAAFHALEQTPSITSPESLSSSAGSPSNLVVTTTGFPASLGVSISYNGALPTGMSFADNHNGTATLAGTPAAGTGNIYSAQIKATNGISNATQSFTLFVSDSPRITSAQAASLSLGKPGVFIIVAAGYPASTISLAGSLPSGITFTDSGNGIATLSGTPAANSQGIYPLSLVATNGIAPSATQNLSLIIQEPPSFASAPTTTMTLGQAMSYTITTTGFPKPAISTTSALPSGVTLTDHGDGTASLAGLPAPGTNGAYAIALVATNTASPNATQNFTLLISQAPVITSSTSATFTIGALGSYTIASTGYPKPALSIASPLPRGLTFHDNGNGTAMLSGIPSPNSQGSFSIDVVAANGSSLTASQTLNLVVQDSPMITSVPVATFTVGVLGSYAIAATGYPSPIITTATALPSGLTLTDNNDGTATLSGTPAANTQGIHAITIVASNGVAQAASQRVTLTIAGPPAAPPTGGSVNSNTGSTISNSVSSSGCDALRNGQTHPDALVIGLLILFSVGIRARRSRRS